jgi:aminomethyltransferase
MFSRLSTGLRKFSSEPLVRTAFYEQHLALGGKMVPFAGYELPVQYKETIPVSHKHVRSAAGLFDVSHMGQIRVHGPRDQRLNFLETLCVGELHELGANQAKLTVLTNENGGIIDDCIMTDMVDHTFVVVNGACKHGDLKHMRAHLDVYNAENKTDVQIEYLEDSRSLLALQGPQAVQVVERLSGQNLSDLTFMHRADFDVAGVPCWVSRCGYTGEDGFELSMPSDVAPQLMDAILAEPETMPIGLAARDSLRLEAGLCLYGHDLNETTTPTSASLLFTIGKRRRAEGGFLGFEKISEELKQKNYTHKRVGLVVEKGAPAREGAEIVDENGEVIGNITSGTVSPSLGSKLSMGYIKKAFFKSGTKVHVRVRGKTNPATVTKMPFLRPNYYTGN